MSMISNSADSCAWSGIVENSASSKPWSWSYCTLCRMISSQSSGLTPKRKANFSDRYDLGETLGTGAFATVKLGIKLDDGSRYAIKIVTKSKLSRSDERSLRDEISILQELHKFPDPNPHIIKLISVYNEPHYYYLVTELVEGGGLFHRIVKKKSYSENETREICRILIGAIGYCHDHNFCHRDLKPENLLLMSNDNDSDIKIADFGFARRVTSEACLSTKCGTPYYVAPEILNSVLYGTKVDMWSLGVITYILLAGYPPFEDINLRRLFHRICVGKFTFHEEYWAEISNHAKDLVTNLLKVNPKQRFNAHQALEHPWFQDDQKELQAHDLKDSLSKLRTFNAHRKLKATVYAVTMSSTFHGKKHSVSVEYDNSHYEK